MVKTWSSKKDKGKSGILNAIVARFRQTFTTKMIIAWTVYILLLWYV